MADDTEAAELADIDGVGDATVGRLEDADYDSVEALADADPETVAEDVSYVDEGDAEDFVEQAEELTADTAEDEEAEDTTDESEEGDVSIETPTDADDTAEDASTDESTTDEAASEEPVPDPTAGETASEDETYQLEFTAEGEQYDYVVAALVSVKIGKTNVSSSMAEAADNVLTELREMEGGGTFIGNLTEQELNTLHAALTQAVARYRGAGNTGPFQAVNSVLEDVEEARQQYLFS